MPWWEFMKVLFDCLIVLCETRNKTAEVRMGEGGLERYKLRIQLYLPLVYIL